jgi:pimeloyl-ACP methyl ester carboxylesterase
MPWHGSARRKQVRAPAARVAAAALALLAAGCTAAPQDRAAPPAQGPGPLDLGRYLAQEVDWQPCPDGDEFLAEVPAGLSCAEVQVPVDYTGTATGLGDFTISLIKAPASGTPAGSILVNPGGPGASGVESVARSADDLRRNLPGYDIVGFDPRGVSRSDGLDCEEPVAVRRDLVELDATPEEPGELAAVVAAHESYEAACRASEPRWGFLGTRSVAQDVALLSALLGDDRIHFYGMSYGTEIGYELLRTFPDRIGRMVLESPVDPAVEDPFVDQYAAFDAALAALLADCAAPQHQQCGAGRTPDGVRADFLTAAGELEEPGAFQTLTDDGAASESLVLFGLALPLYLEIDDQLRGLYLEALGALLNERDARPLEYWGYLYHSYDVEQQRFTTTDDIQALVGCLDVAEPPAAFDPAAERAEEAANLAELQVRAPLLSAIGFAGALLDDRRYQPCTYSAAAFADPAVPDPLLAPAPVANPAGAPVLVMGITGDTATPYPWAERIAGRLGVPLLTNDTSGHAVYPGSSNTCLRAVVADYLASGSLPPGPVGC